MKQPMVPMALTVSTEPTEPTALRPPGAIAGAPGKREPDPGMSAYDLYASTTTDSPVLSQNDWLKSLKGVPGKDGAPGAPGADGKRGPTGQSAYDLYASTTTDNPVLAE